MNCIKETSRKISLGVMMTTRKKTRMDEIDEDLINVANILEELNQRIFQLELIFYEAFGKNKRSKTTVKQINDKVKEFQERLNAIK